MNHTILSQIFISCCFLQVVYCFDYGIWNEALFKRNFNYKCKVKVSLGMVDIHVYMYIADLYEFQWASAELYQQTCLFPLIINNQVICLLFVIYIPLFIYNLIHQIVELLKFYWSYTWTFFFTFFIIEYFFFFFRMRLL